MLWNSIIKAMVCGLFVTIITSGITPGMLETKNQKVEPNTVSGNDGGFPTVGYIGITWWGRLVNRPSVTVGYPEDRNYSFPIVNGSVQLVFNVRCLISTEDILLPIAHYSFCAGEIRNNNGIRLGRTSSWTTIRNRGGQDFNLTVYSNSFPANVNGSGNFTIKIVGLGWPPKLSINSYSYPVWVSYTEER